MNSLCLLSIPVSSYVLTTNKSYTDIINIKSETLVSESVKIATISVEQNAVDIYALNHNLTQYIKNDELPTYFAVTNIEPTPEELQAEPARIWFIKLKSIHLQPLCFTAEEANSTVLLDNVAGVYKIKLNDSVWLDYDLGTIITLLNIGDKVYFSAKTTNDSCKYNYGESGFVMTGKIAASGNIQSLLDLSCARTDAPEKCYNYLFSGCTALISAPELPAILLADYCYYGMFNTTSITLAPVLPATVLAGYCYSEMFSHCTALTTAPVLPATRLMQACYQSMFSHCTALTTAPVLPATLLMHTCYQNMFLHCTSLTSISVKFTDWTNYGELTDPTKNWVQDIFQSGIFYCSKELPELYGNDYIPNGWTIVNI